LMLMSSIIVTSPRTSCAAVNTSSHPRAFECVICAAPFADADEQHHRDFAAHLLCCREHEQSPSPRAFECVICAAPFADADEQHHRDFATHLLCYREYEHCSRLRGMPENRLDAPRHLCTTVYATMCTFSLTLRECFT
jgi:hypothetical protein